MTIELIHVVIPARNEDRLVGRALAALDAAVATVRATAPDVRRAGVAHASNRVSKRSPERVWIASIDADSEVPRDWLVDQLQLSSAQRTI